DRLEVVEQDRAAIPGRVVRSCRYVVAESGRNRNCDNRGKAKLRGERAIFGGDAVEGVFLIGDQIDLVDGDDDMAQTEQRADQRVPPRLHQNAFARIDQEDGQVGI